MCKIFRVNGKNITLAFALLILTFVLAFVLMDQAGTPYSVLDILLNPLGYLLGFIISSIYPEGYAGHLNADMIMWLNLVLIFIWDYALACIIIWLASKLRFRKEIKVRPLKSRSAKLKPAKKRNKNKKSR
jgi:glycopeptide antibiotics resistance protein